VQRQGLAINKPTSMRTNAGSEWCKCNGFVRAGDGVPVFQVNSDDDMYRQRHCSSEHVGSK
jgi:hypothetical protein